MAYATITKPSLQFNTKLYTGAGGTQNITGVGFQPDFVWIKERSQAEPHVLFDAVRGVTKALNSNDESVDDTISNALTTFGTDGFTVSGNGATNENSQTYVSWNWKANGAGSSNSNGSITATVSANTTAGFSIVSYTGTGSNATVGHGLNTAPKIILIKNRDAAHSWSVYSNYIGSDDYLKLDTDSSKDTNTTRFNDTHPTSTVFSLGTHGSGNASGEEFIAYCFTEVKGFSRFGQYNGNGASDGTFAYTGFKPAFVLIKNVSSNGSNWQIYDNKREGYNTQNDLIRANLTDAEGNGTDPIDILSNGFKNRHTAASQNTNNDTYIYMAFAEEPLVANVGSGIPATAR